MGGRGHSTSRGASEAMRSIDELSGRPSRHARVWLDPSTWREHLRSAHDARSLHALAGWVAEGRPAVARRREASAGDACALAIALPLAQGRARIPFLVDPHTIVRVAQPLRLEDVIASAPPAWQAALSGLVMRGERFGTSFHAYGSLAWQHITGESCVTPQSDVDLLWAARDVAHIERTLALLIAWERESGLRADGELLLPDSRACAWRELLSRPERVLIKTDGGVAMLVSPLSASPRSASPLRAAKKVA